MALEDGLQVGENCSLAGDVYFGTKPYLVKIGNRVDVSRGVVFITHDGADAWLFADRPDYTDFKYYESIEIKDNCFIGIRTILLPGVTVGPNSIIGAGSVVTRDVPPDTVASGNPARPVCSVAVYRELLRNRSFPYSRELRRNKAQFRKAVEENMEVLRSWREAAHQNGKGVVNRRAG